MDSLGLGGAQLIQPCAEGFRVPIGTEILIVFPKRNVSNKKTFLCRNNTPKKLSYQ